MSAVTVSVEKTKLEKEEMKENQGLPRKCLRLSLTQADSHPQPERTWTVQIEQPRTRFATKGMLYTTLNVLGTFTAFLDEPKIIG